jgi:hypothetical protein
VTLPERGLIAGRYRIERQIGAGGMGSVYLATDTESGRQVALKQAHEGRRPADREAAIARDLRHPRLVALYDSIATEGESWLVMEYVPSRNLATIIADDGPLPAEKVAHLGRQVAEALQVLHEKGVVHGDVSPGNVLVTDDGDAKLTDFGVAREIWSDATVTAGALVAGTPAYLAPEVARGGERTPASDIFSLGATLFAAVEGVSPLGDAENPLTAVWRSASGHVAAPTAGPLGPALSRMLRVEPGERPDATEAKQLLERTEAPARGSRKAALLVAAAIGIAAAIAVGVTIAVTHDDSGAKPPRRADPARTVATVGDPRTADVCALLQPNTLRAYGAPRLVTDYGGFNRCDVLISKNDEDFADTNVTLELGPAPEFDAQVTRQTQGAITVVSEPGDDQGCDRYLLLPDGNTVVVEAKLLGSGSMDLCAAASAATSYATTVLNRAAIPRRADVWPAASLADVDACSLLDPSVLARTAGFGAPAAGAGFGRWACDYADDAGVLAADVRFDRNSTLTSDDGQPTTLAGRSAFVSPEDGGPKTCLVSVVYRAYRNPDGDAMEEIVELEVDGSRPISELCADAKSLATVIATKLPGGGQ